MQSNDRGLTKTFSVQTHVLTQPFNLGLSPPLCVPPLPAPHFSGTLLPAPTRILTRRPQIHKHGTFLSTVYCLSDSLVASKPSIDSNSQRESTLRRH